MIQAMIDLANLLEGGIEFFLAGVPGPNPNAVPRDMTVRDYLDQKKLARWYQKLLFVNTRVSAAVKPPNGEPGALESVVDQNMALPAGSLVHVDERRTGEFKTSVDRATNQALDYVFNPDAGSNLNGIDKFLDSQDKLYRGLGSFMFGGGHLRTLQEFIRDIGINEYVNTPPRNLVIISHAYWGGKLEFAPTRNQQGEYLSYEDVARLAPQLRLDDKFLEHRKADNEPPFLIFTGCNFGKAEPFLRALRDAINPHLAAVASNFFLGIKADTNKNKFTEYMAFPYYVYSDRALSRAELVNELKQNPKRKDAHRDDVQDNEWEGWVPAEPWSVDTLITNPANGVILWYEIINQQMQRVDVNVTKSTFEADPIRHYKNAIAALRADRTHPLSAAHPYPWWKRFVIDDANKMVDTFRWNFNFIEEKLGATNKVIGTANAHHYSLLVPIVKQGAAAYNLRELIMNEYIWKPKQGVLERVRTDLPLPSLPRSAANTKFWNLIEPSV